MAKKYTNNKVMDLFNFLVKTQGGPGAFEQDNPLNPSYTGFLTKDAKGIDKAKLAEHFAKAANPAQAEELFNKNIADRAALLDTSEGVSLGQLGRLGWGAMKAHPGVSLGLGIGTAANIGGLTDNDKFGAQLGLGTLGGFVGNAIGAPMIGPAMGAITGGALGAQLDKLRAAREQQAVQAQQRLGR